MNRIYRILFLVAAALMMQSCFTAKNYKRPDIKKEDLYRTEAIAQDSASMAEVSWRAMFTDPILQQHIESGLANNYDVRIALQNIAISEAYLKQAKAAYIPTLTGTASVTHQELAQNSQFGRLFSNLDSYLLGANLSWEADIWGKIRSNKRAYNASYLQTVAATQTVKTTVIANIATMYYRLLALDEQLKITDSTLVNRNESVEAIRALKDAGNVNEVGVKQTEAQQYATQLIIEDLKNEIVLTENSLSLLMGEAPHRIRRSSLDAQQLDAEVKPGYSSALLRNRPDVIAAEYGLVNAFELTNVARSNFYPSFTLTAQGGLQSIDFQKWFSANSLFATVVAGLAQPILNQRQIRSEYEAAQSRQQQAYLRFEQALVTAGREVSDALADYNNETRKMAIRQQQAEALRLAADYSDELLEYGLVNYLEVLTAKDNALNTRLNLVDNKYNRFAALVELYRALGGGWQ